MPDSLVPPQPDPQGSPDPTAALLHDLQALSSYLHARGQRTYAMAQQFVENARKHPESRAYDERQATMLEYQHYIWQEIAGLLDRLVLTYGEAVDHSSTDDQTPQDEDS